MSVAATSWPEWFALIDAEGRHVPSDSRKSFERMCREMRHVLPQNIPAFVSIYLIYEKASPLAVNHAIRVVERAKAKGFAVPPPGSYPP